MKKIESLIKDKEDLCKERDALADLYTEYIQRLVENENDSIVYADYVNKISELEPATKITKERMRELNRQIDALKKTTD